MHTWPVNSIGIINSAKIALHFHSHKLGGWVGRLVWGGVVEPFVKGVARGSFDFSQGDLPRFHGKP